MANPKREKIQTPPIFSQCANTDCGAVNFHQRNGEGPMNTLTGEKVCRVCLGPVIEITKEQYDAGIQARKLKV